MNAPLDTLQQRPVGKQALADRVSVLERELASVRRQLADLLDLERYRDLVLNRYGSLEGAALSRDAMVTARDFLEAGSGFHALEYSDGGAAYRWTGPAPESRLTFWVDRSQAGEVRLHLQSFGVADPKAPLRVRVDGVVYATHQLPGGPIFAAGPILPRETPGPTEIVIHCDAMYCPKDAGGGDDRHLGLAISRIEYVAL